MGKFGNPNPSAPAAVPVQPSPLRRPVAGANQWTTMPIDWSGGAGQVPTGGIGKDQLPPRSPFDQAWSPNPVPLGPDGRPLAPQFRTVGNASTGLLKDPYNIKNNMDPRAMEAARTEAYRDPGALSKWGQLALSDAQNQAASQSAGAQSQAQNQLAMSGGLRSGARERLASQGMRDRLSAGQGALSGVKMQDEMNRQKWLQMMPGLEQQTASFDQGVQDKNISRALQELNIGRAMQQGQFTEAMKAWAAEKMAQASRGGGDSGGFLSNFFSGLGF